MSGKRTSHFNYRMLAFEAPDKSYVILRIHEVYYNFGKPTGYGEPPAIVIGDDIPELKLVIDLIELAITKPILWADDRFPQEYKPA